MAGPPLLDTGQLNIITYLFIFLLPIIIIFLMRSVFPDNPKALRFLMVTILRGTPWPIRGHRGPIWRRRRKVKVKFKNRNPEATTTTKHWLRAQLFALAMTSLKVGCQVESSFRYPRQSLFAFAGIKGNSTSGQVHFDSDSFPIRIDNHASYCMANSPHLFDDLVLSDVGKVDGINDGLAILGKGTFKFSITDDDGRVHHIRIPNSLYLPKLHGCLLSPQHWAQEAGDNETWMGNYAHSCILHWRGGTKTVPFHASTNTPIFHTASSSSTYRVFAATFEAMEAPFFRRETTLQLPRPRFPRESVIPEEFVAEEDLHRSEKKSVDTTNEDDDTVRTSNLPPPPVEENPSEGSIRRGPLTFDPNPPEAEEEDSPLSAADDQAELMRWHYRLGHLPFAKLKQLALHGKIPKKLALLNPPKCAGCLFGAMTKIPWRGKEPKSSHKVFTATKPGETVSVDQMVSTEVGFFAQLKGKLTKKRYRCCTIFVDHYSKLRFVHNQIDDSSVETVAAKHAFEKFAAEHGVRIHHYHCDNGRFYDNAFKESCENSRQRLTFCGVNAHFQNGIAERAIRDISESARKQLLHARARWPAAVHFSLWPYAVRNAVLLHNSLPVLEDGTSRLELFSSIRVGCNMRHIHTFACPVFALDNALASGKSLPRWSPRARLGLNLGPSPIHARNVYLVLNLITGCVSPQYHCRFDDFFETTRHGGPDVSGTICWQQLAGLSRAEQTSMDFEQHPSSSTVQNEIPSDTVFPSDEFSIPTIDHEATMDDETSTAGESLPSRTPHQSQASTQAEGALQIEPTITAGTSRTGRIRVMSQRMAESASQRDFFGNAGMHYMANQSTASHDETPEDLFHDQHLALQERMRNPIAFHAEMMGDIMYYHQALQQPDAKQFADAVVKEVNGHVDNNHWNLIKREDVPEDAQVVPSVWSMRRKRNLTTNEITKHKARLNLHGGKQIFGMNYFETYAPVVTWFAIRLMIVMGIIFSWALRQVDFVMAYPQAPIETDIYMELPQGIQTKTGNSKDHVLKLLKNIYGQKQAGRVWNSFLVDKLISLGYTASLIDDCVFFRGDIIFMVYVDDGIFLGNNDAQLQQAIKEIQGLGLNIEDQGHPADYVGVNIKKLRDGSYEFTQRALIDSIIDDVGIKDSNTKPVPAKVSLRLHAFKEEPVFNLNFNYRSVVGKLNYLAQTTRPDIMYATHQIAKYSSDPRTSHGEAVVYLIRYLKKTRDLGLHFRPDPSKGFECYCDADFSGLWNKAFAPVDSSTSKSRSGWIIFYAGCPISWASKLQSQVALSTTEAEYIAMSQALRDIIPIMGLLQEMRERGFKVLCTEPYVYCKVFEDNSGALELARLPKLRPRTKHINVCYHHFREHVRKGLIKIFPVDTKDQIADALTKPLAQNDFQRHRRFMCGK